MMLCALLRSYAMHRRLMRMRVMRVFARRPYKHNDYTIYGSRRRRMDLPTNCDADGKRTAVGWNMCAKTQFLHHTGGKHHTLARNK